MYRDKPGLYLVCTLYVLVHTRKNKKIKLYKVGYRTQDLMHTNWWVIPLGYHRAFLGDTGG
jgi:hypothetical protein